MYFWNWKGSTRRDYYVQSDGTFTINLTADDVANASATYVNSVYNNGRACFDQSSFSVSKTTSGSVDYVRVNTSGGYSGVAARTVYPSGAEADLGDFLIWPVTGFALTSDIAVKFESSYEGGTGGVGNINYRTSHGMSTLYPININTRITLTDQAGNKYVSPYVKYGIGQHCSQVTLNYAGGQFSWSPAGTVSVGDSSSSLAALLKSISAALNGIEQKIQGLK